MTEEEKNTQEEHNTSSMPDDHHHHHHPPLTDTDKAFIDYQIGLIKTEIPNGHTLLKNSIIKNHSQRVIRRNKRCVLIKAEITNHFYQTLNNNITVLAQQDAEEIRNNVADYIAQNASLETKLTEALKAIKTAKDKVLIAKDKAYKMDEARKNSSLSDAIAEMEKIYPGKKGLFGAVVEEIKNNADDTLNMADDALEVAIKVSGIRAGANVENLKTVSIELSDKTAQINKDVATNITETSKLITEAQSAYDAALKDLSISKYDKYEKTLGYEATLDITTQVHHLDCARWEQQKFTEELDCLATKIEGNFTDED